MSKFVIGGKYWENDRLLSITPVKFFPFPNCHMCDMFKEISEKFPLVFEDEKQDIRTHMIHTHHSFNFSIPSGIEPVIES